MIYRVVNSIELDHVDVNHICAYTCMYTVLQTVQKPGEYFLWSDTYWSL